MNMYRVGAKERERELVREMFPQVLHAATISADQKKRGKTITKPVRKIWEEEIICIYSFRSTVELSY
jgi:hypothetical protein